MKIIGIDPGSNITGFGVIEVVGKKINYVDGGVIRVVGKEVSVKLRTIFSELNKILEKHQPEQASIEKIFVHINANSALKLGEARGVALTALASQYIDIYEYSARQVKQAIVGFGAARKNQMQHMVKALLDLDHEPSPDAADALAIAICHANYSSSPLAIAGGKKLPRSWRKMSVEDIKELTT